MNRAPGFTLIELMVVIAVVAILMIVAVPNMRNFLQNNRITAAANQVHASLNLARTEAIKRQLPIRFEATASAGATNEFGGGWVVYNDLNSDADYDAGTDDLIARVDALPGGATLDVTGGTVTRLDFAASGTASAATTFALRIPACRGDQGRNIAVTAIGRVSVSKVGC
jgi:type IV fimbrial biogenesis protein FimT